jgi:D-alanine-D-alanine ligase
MNSQHVVILYNEPVLPLDHPEIAAEREVLETVSFVQGSLASAGFAVSCFGASHDVDQLLTGLRTLQPDVVFNLFEGTGDDGNNEAYVAGLLEWLGIPYTGCPFQALCVARNKPLTKTLFQGAGLPTARHLVVERLPVPESSLAWPVIVKPALQDASVGLDHSSVVADAAHLSERIAILLERYGPPVLVEEYIDGRELNVALIEAPELRVLPVSEVLFVDMPPGCWPIVTYDAKWTPGSRDFQATPTRLPADIPERVATQLAELATRAFRLLGCRDFARVDFRLRASGEPYLLEVNPNPSYHPTAGFADALAAAGITDEEFAARLVDNAEKRCAGTRRTLL